MYLYSFEKLDVWKLSRELVKRIYIITKKFPSEEKFGLVNQLQRAAVSITSNIAEGSSRSSLKDQIRFLEISYGSLMEVYSQLCISTDLEYISDLELQDFRLMINEISNKLKALKISFMQN